MVVFTLVNSQNSGGYYIASTMTSMGWRGLPHDLADVMEDVRRKGEEVEEVSTGLDGDWFLRTNARHACKTEHGRADMISNVELFAQLAERGGLELGDYAIQFFTFVPDPTGYVTVLHKIDSSVTRCAWHNVPPVLDQLLEREASQGVRHVAVGKNGAHVVILNTGVVWWGYVPDSLHRLLDDAEKRGRGVVNVALSLLVEDWYFIEFADGGVDYSLPSTWHDSINKHTALCAKSGRHSMVTSYNSSPSSPLYSPQISQSGSFNPFNPLGNGYGYSSPAPNPYLSPMFTGMQQPVYNFTNVYNTGQQEPEKQSHSGTFQLLGGALKVAGAVLPLFTGGVGFGTGIGGF
ncbi:hypothetical protein BC834DRAFT_888945 [Gloeopeniophorella convolvens]|nr:hypothetical protein BC834DRAFT_888945 [Gloeopeniophorella convolvens]